MTPGDDTVLGGPARPFPSTHWSVVSAARDRSDPRWRERVEALARLYWKPVYRHIRMAWGLGNEEAKDLTQGFFVHLLEGAVFERASAARGRFRAFVKACLENFLREAKRDAGRLKRGGGARLLSLDMEDAAPPEPASPAPSPEESLDREWRRALLEEAVARLRAAYAAEGRGEWFEAFRRVDLEGERYREAAAALGVSETDVDNRVRHARRRMFGIVRGIVAESVSDPEALAAELRELFPGS